MAKLKTGRHTSALKENRKNSKRRAANAAQRSFLKTLTKKVEDAVEKKDGERAKALLNEAFSAFDKTVKIKHIHKNKAARKKRQLAKKVHGLGK